MRLDLKTNLDADRAQVHQDHSKSNRGPASRVESFTLGCPNKPGAHLTRQKCMHMDWREEKAREVLLLVLAALTRSKEHTVQ